MSAEDARATIHVNGRPRTLDVDRLADLVRALGYGEEAAGIAVALNGEVVPRAAWPRTGLSAGDNVEIVGAVQGG